MRRGAGQTLSGSTHHQRAFAFSQPSLPSQQQSSSQQHVGSAASSESFPASIPETSPLGVATTRGPHDICISNLKFGFQAMELGDFLHEKHQIIVSI